MSDIKQINETAFELREDITPSNANVDVRNAVNEALAMLNNGSARVAEKKGNHWVVNEWLKKAVLLSFSLSDNKIILGDETNFYDKFDPKFANFNEDDFIKAGIRVVPPANVRYGSYIAPGVILMPSYVNMGAYIDSGTMIDTWATVGSCAQIGKNVHLSGGVGIGGVLEPLQARPTIIEDDCFIGARSEIVEGVIIESGAVISMGVYISQSTKIFNRMTGEITYGRIPRHSVVVSGNLPSKDGTHSLYCAIIVKKVNAKTLGKIGINKLLRNI
ncbi:MAG: 2,3,4,5-tetrahydropyridine-2,6-dicarboxylate N-succinyltransferase [Piscirickettsiaceae bacterium]|nr:2,3,4,5-tetrahydropyridine-2,6-dicarboxylate N-succinyltransferase [Piscirickettsiaceae bacterium]